MEGTVITIYTYKDLITPRFFKRNNSWDSVTIYTYKDLI